MPDEQRPRSCAILQVPAYVDRELTIIWNDGRPRGLIVDGAVYAVRPSPRLRAAGS